MELDFNETEKPEPETVTRKGKRSSVSGPFVCAWVLISLVLCAVIGGLLYVIFQKEAECNDRAQGSRTTLVQDRNETTVEGMRGPIVHYNESDVTAVCPPESGACSSPPALSTRELRTLNQTSLKLPNLPRVISPYHYDLELFPDFYGSVEDMVADGKVSIYFTVLVKTAAITVNVLELDIDEDSVRLDPVAPSKDGPGVRGISYKNQSQLLVIQLDTELPPLGRYKIQIKYRARVDFGPHGIYAYSYVDAEGKISKTATTYFNDGFARRAFPCFDEPSFKTTFNLTLLWRASEKLSTWSNTEIWYQEPRKSGILADVYQRTPNMSTCDLAFTVGNYAYLQNVTSAGVKFRTVARPDELPRVQLLHKHGPAVFDWFENTFDPPYPLSKYDNVVVRNVKHVVVEHWGSTTLRGTSVYTEEGRIAEQRLARLTAQGVSQQWFGDLVTPAGEEWAWLSKGISTFLDSYALAQIYPEWREMEMFVARVHSSMRMDADITRPVSITPDKDDQMTKEKVGT
ncbi:uncharacterized protein [Haliotis cracherodii]|uniref:uncharacterized protein n=1 Tax=Haliotis cracherodii TaxID=6455 RepID=UPI0039EA3649